MHRAIISSDTTEYVELFCSFTNGIKQEEQPQQQIKLMKPQRRAHRLHVSLHGCVNDSDSFYLIILFTWVSFSVQGAGFFSQCSGTRGRKWSVSFWRQLVVLWELFTAAVKMHMCCSSSLSLSLGWTARLWCSKDACHRSVALREQGNFSNNSRVILMMYLKC